MLQNSVVVQAGKGPSYNQSQQHAPVVDDIQLSCIVLVFCMVDLSTFLFQSIGGVCNYAKGENHKGLHHIDHDIPNLEQIITGNSRSKSYYRSFRTPLHKTGVTDYIDSTYHGNKQGNSRNHAKSIVNFLPFGPAVERLAQRNVQINCEEQVEADDEGFCHHEETIIDFAEGCGVCLDDMEREGLEDVLQAGFLLELEDIKPDYQEVVV
jgi:hypothetical protein